YLASALGVTPTFIRVERKSPKFAGKSIAVLQRHGRITPAASLFSRRAPRCGPIDRESSGHHLLATFVAGFAVLAIRSIRSERQLRPRCRGERQGARGE